MSLLKSTGFKLLIIWLHASWVVSDTLADGIISSHDSVFCNNSNCPSTAVWTRLTPVIYFKKVVDAHFKGMPLRLVELIIRKLVSCNCSPTQNPAASMKWRWPQCIWSYTEALGIGVADSNIKGEVRVVESHQSGCCSTRRLHVLFGDSSRGVFLVSLQSKCFQTERRLMLGVLSEKCTR